jgi:hypothetical protein
MTILEELKEAVLDGNYPRAHEILAALSTPHCTADEGSQIVALLVWALQIVRAGRSQEAFLLSQLTSRQGRAFVAAAYNSLEHG